MSTQTQHSHASVRAPVDFGLQNTPPHHCRAHKHKHNTCMHPKNIPWNEIEEYASTTSQNTKKQHAHVPLSLYNSCDLNKSHTSTSPQNYISTTPQNYISTSSQNTQKERHPHASGKALAAANVRGCLPGEEVACGAMVQQQKRGVGHSGRYPDLVAQHSLTALSQNLSE